MSTHEFPNGESQAPNREELLQLAINTARAGNKKPARLMFEQVLKQDKNNERAMMWLAKLADSKAERQEWLKRALRINPNNEQARDALKTIDYRGSAKDNRVLLTFGVLAAILIILAVVIVLAIASRPV